MMTEYKLYNGEVTIFHQPDPSAYYIVGEDGKKRRLAGPTTELAIINKPALIPWAVGKAINLVRKNIDLLKEDPETILRMAKEEPDKERDTAGDIGRAIHAWAEGYIKGELPEMPEDPKVVRGVMAFVDWINSTGAKLLEAERVIYSRKYDFAGRLDLILEIDGRRYLGDIKTGSGVYAEALAQTAGYQCAYEEETGTQLDGRVIIWLAKDSEEEFRAKLAEKGKTGVWQAFKTIFLPRDDNSLSPETDLYGLIKAKELRYWQRQADKRLKDCS
jgi:uncharacterized protein YlaN (UPF0358 family)